MARVIDCWVNPFTPEVAKAQQPEFLERVTKDYFHRAEEVFAARRSTRWCADGQPRHRARLLTINAADPAPMAEMAARYGEPLPALRGDRPDAGHGGRADGRAAGAGLERPPDPHGAVPVQPPAERQGVLPGLRQVHRARRRRLRQHRHSRPADAGRAAAPAVSRRGLPLLPRPRPHHGARRRPVVGRGHPLAAEVSEPLHDDVGVPAEVSARRADPVHEHARPGQDPVRHRLPVPALRPRRRRPPAPCPSGRACWRSTCATTPAACSSAEFHHRGHRGSSASIVGSGIVC